MGSFDHSVCCLCMRSACNRMPLYALLYFLNFFIAIGGSIVNLVFFCNHNMPIILLVIGMSLHAASFVLDLTMSTYPFRFCIGMDGKKSDKSHREECGNARFGAYSGKTYVLLLLYLVTMIVLLGNIGIEASVPGNRADLVADAGRALIGVFVYYCSFLLALVWTLVRKPTCTDRVDEAGEPYHEDSETNIDSGVSGSVLFAVSYAIMNGSLGVYYTDSIFYYLAAGAAGIGLLWGAAIGVFVLVKARFSAQDTAGLFWACIIGTTCCCAIACFIYALAGFSIDPDFKLHTQIQWIAFLVQGGIPLLILACFIIYLLVIGVIFCGECCCTGIKESIREAKKQALYETTPLNINGEK